MSDKQSPTFYIFHGEDDLSIDEAVAKLRAEMGDDANADLNINEMEGTEANVPEVSVLLRRILSLRIDD